MSQYETWYEFKKDLERRAGHSLLNAEWLRVKPTAPLPWREAGLRSSLLRLGRLENRKTDQRRVVVAN